MLEPSDLPDERIIAAVRRHYGLQLTALAFLPLGQDVRASAYRAATGDASYFLKLRRRAANRPALRVPRYLTDRGVPHVVAPLRTRARRLSAAVEGFTLALYPFIDGRTGGAHGLQERHWVTYGAALRAIHDTPPGPDLARDVPRESFTSPAAAVVKTWAAHIPTKGGRDPIARDLAALWRAKRAEIRALVARLETLGQRLRTERPALVLCHADVHHNNVLIDTGDRFWIVDWDDTRLAPKECDLMMGVGGLGGAVVGPREEAWFLRGYGPTTIDLVALAYYRHLRVVGDIAEYGEQVWLLPTIGEATRRNALQRTARAFAPGNSVALANQLARVAT